MTVRSKNEWKGSTDLVKCHKSYEFTLSESRSESYKACYYICAKVKRYFALEI